MARLPWLDNASPANRAAFYWLAASIFVIIALGQGIVASGRLVFDGKHAIATITSHDSHDDCHYTFTTAAGSQYTGHDGACASDHPIGTTLTITYLPADPTDTTIGSPALNLWQRVAIFVLLPNGLALTIYLRGKSKLKRRRQSSPIAGP